MHLALAELPPGTGPGQIVRAARKARGLTLAGLGRLTGYSAAQVSRYERGITPLADVAVLRRFAAALSIPPHQFGLAPSADSGLQRHARPFAMASTRPGGAWSTVAGSPGLADGQEDDVRRRQLLANLALTAAGAITGQATGPPPAAQAGNAALADLLISRVRDAMLGLGPGPSSGVTQDDLRAGLASALADFHHCRYARLAERLPRLICAGHLLAAGGSARQSGVLLAGIYTLATRMLIKLDDQQLGWMAADRAKVIAAGSDPLLEAEAARNLAVLARKAAWHDQAAAIALTAAASPRLRGGDPRLAAQRGLLIQSAAYTAARAGDRTGMRELTGQAAAIAGTLNGAMLLRDHGGGFTPATVGLHRISAENYAGDPGEAIAAANQIRPASLPTTERRARYWTDTARACAQWGRRQDCTQALLAAEYEAPQDVHARPAIRDLIRSLLITGRTSPELRGLAARSGIT